MDDGKSTLGHMRTSSMPLMKSHAPARHTDTLLTCLQTIDGRTPPIGHKWPCDHGDPCYSDLAVRVKIAKLQSLLGLAFVCKGSDA